MSTQPECNAFADRHLCTAISNIRTNRQDEYTDIKITCGDDTYHAHRVIICAQSGWLKAACRPRNFMEGQSGTIELTERPDGALSVDEGDTRRSVAAMLAFCYGTYSYHWKDTLYYLELIAIADKYDIRAMRQVYLTRFMHLFKRFGTDPGTWAQATEFIYLNLQHIEIIKWQMREKAILHHLKYLSTPEGSDFLDRVPDSAIDFVQSLHRSYFVSPSNREEPKFRGLEENVVSRKPRAFLRGL